MGEGEAKGRGRGKDRESEGTKRKSGGDEKRRERLLTFISHACPFHSLSCIQSPWSPDLLQDSAIPGVVLTNASLVSYLLPDHVQISTEIEIKISETWQLDLDWINKQPHLSQEF